MTLFFADPKYTIETERLILRPLQAEDFAPLSEMAKDEETMRYIGGLKDPALVWRAFALLVGHWQLRGYGFFSVIEKQTGQWIGRVGPWNPYLWPEPEVGWTIIRSHWKQGFAREAAIASTHWMFANLDWPKVTHMIDPDNIGSKAVARSIGSRKLREIDQLPGFGDMKIEIWGQSRAQWAAQHGS